MTRDKSCLYRSPISSEISSTIDGLSKVFIDQKDNKVNGGFWGNFRELTLGVQIFNAFNILNTVANQWVTDVSTGYNYPVPVRLTGRFFNVKLEFKL